MFSARILEKLKTRSRQERSLLLEAVAWIGLMQALIPSIKFKRIAGLFRLAAGEKRQVLSPEQAAEASTIGWAVAAAAARGPWRPLCLGQALAGMAMLRRRQIPGTLYLGVAASAFPPVPSISGDPFAAHAWVRCGDAVITGESGFEQFSVIASFTWG
jgi:hypothetical protein